MAPTTLEDVQVEWPAEGTAVVVFSGEHDLLTKWAAQTEKVEASSTPEQRTRRAAGLENRRKRAARLALNRAGA